MIWTRSATAPTSETGTYDLDSKEYTLPADWEHHIDELSGDDPLYFNTIRITKAGQTTTGVDAGTPREFGGSGAGIVPYVDGDAFSEGQYVRDDGLEYYVLQDDDGTNGPPADNPTYYDPLKSTAVRALHTPHDSISSSMDVDYSASTNSSRNNGVHVGGGSLDFNNEELENSFSRSGTIYTVDEDVDSIRVTGSARTLGLTGNNINLRNFDSSNTVEVDSLGIRIVKNRGETDESIHNVIERTDNITLNANSATAVQLSTGSDNTVVPAFSMDLEAGDTIQVEAFAIAVNSSQQNELGIRRVDIANEVRLTVNVTFDDWAVDFTYDESTREFGVQNENRDTHGLFNPAGQPVGTLKSWADERDYIPIPFYIDSDSPEEQYAAADFTWDSTNEEWNTPTGVVVDRPGTVSDSLHIIFMFHTNEDEPVAQVVLPTLPYGGDLTIETQFSQGYSSSGTWANSLGPDSRFFRLVINGVATRAFRLANFAVDAAESLVSEQVDETHDGAYLSFDHYRHWEDGIRWHSLPPEISVNADNEIVCHANSVTLTFEPIVTAHRYFLMFNHGDTEYTQTETVVRFERLNSDGALDTAINIAEQTDDSFVIGRNSERTLDMELSSGPPTITLSAGQRGRITVLSTPGPEGADDGIKIEGGVLQVGFDVDIQGAAYELDIDEDYLNYRDSNVPDTHPNNRRRIMDFSTGRILISTTPPRLFYGGYNRDNRRGPYHTLNANGKVTWDHNILENHGGDESIVTFLENTAVPAYVDPTQGAVNSVHVSNQVFELAPNTYDIEIRGGISSHGANDHMRAYLRKAVFGDFGLSTHIYEDFAYAGDRFLAIANSNDEIRGWRDDGSRHSAYDINISSAGDRWRAVCYSANRDRIFAIAEEDNSGTNDLQARAWELDGTRQSSDDSGDLSSGIDGGVKAMDALGTRIVVLDAEDQGGFLRLYHSTWDRASSLDVTLPNLTSPATYEGVCFASEGTGYWVLSTDKLEYFSLDGTEDTNREIDLSGISSFDPAGVDLDTENGLLFILDDNANTTLAYNESDGSRVEGSDEVIADSFIVTDNSNNGQFVLVAKSLELTGTEAFYVDFEDYDTSNRPTLGHYMLIENLTA